MNHQVNPDFAAYQLKEMIASVKQLKGVMPEALKQINYLGYSRRVEGDYYSLTQLSEALKCNNHVVYRWLEIPEFVKLLKPHKGEHSTLIHCKNLKKFFTVYPGELARTRPNLVWLVSVLTYTSQHKTDD